MTISVNKVQTYNKIRKTSMINSMLSEMQIYYLFRRYFSSFFHGIENVFSECGGFYMSNSIQQGQIHKSVGFAESRVM